LHVESGVIKLTRALRRPTKAIGGTAGRLKRTLFKPIEALRHEAELGPIIHEEVLAALRRMKEQNPPLAHTIEKAHGYAVVPSMGRASALLGGAFGVGEVFEQGKVIGYASIVQLTLGMQLGGGTFHEIVVFRSAEALKRFKAGKLAFAANASLALVKAGTERAKSFSDGTDTFLFSEGGFLLSLAIGAQKWIFRPAGLGRFRTAKDKRDDQSSGRHITR